MHGAENTRTYRRSKKKVKIYTTYRPGKEKKTLTGSFLSIDSDTFKHSGLMLKYFIDKFRYYMVHFHVCLDSSVNCIDSWSIYCTWCFFNLRSMKTNTKFATKHVYWCKAVHPGAYINSRRVPSSLRYSLMRIFLWYSLSRSLDHRSRRHQSSQSFERLNAVKRQPAAAIMCMWGHSNTINEPDTFEQELTHLLILVCWFLFIFFCHLFEATPQQGVQAGKQLCALYLCHEKQHFPTTLLLCTTI